MEQDVITYKNAVDIIKTAILQSQYRAAKAVNKEQPALYYSIGKFVSENSREGTWGTGAIETISQTLQKELPGLRGFSASNIKNMRQFYEQWSMLTNRQPAAVEMQLSEKVVELKKGTFKPAYLGQLALYLRILDDDERLPGDEYAIRGLNEFKNSLKG